MVNSAFAALSDGVVTGVPVRAAERESPLPLTSPDEEEGHDADGQVDGHPSP